MAHALRNLAHAVERHDPLRLHPEVGVPVALGHALPRDLEDVPEPLGRHQRETVEPLLQERVGRDRRPVRDRRHRAGRRAGEPEDLPQPLEHGERRVLGGGRRLGREDLARPLVHRDDVGERAAGVDPDCGGASVPQSSRARPSRGAIGDSELNSVLGEELRRRP